ASATVQGALTAMGTAPGDAIGRRAAAKTGTADQYASAFSVGYTPHLLGAVWVGNPASPYRFPMGGYPGSCYRLECGGVMYGSMAPGGSRERKALAAPAAPPDTFCPAYPPPTLLPQGRHPGSP